MNPHKLKTSIFGLTPITFSALTPYQYVIRNTSLKNVNMNAELFNNNSQKLIRGIRVIVQTPVYTGTPADVVGLYYRFALKISNNLVPTQNVLTNVAGQTMIEDGLFYGSGLTPSINYLGGIDWEYPHSIDMSGGIGLLNPTDDLNFVLFLGNLDGVNTWTGPTIDAYITIYWEQIC